MSALPYSSTSLKVLICASAVSLGDGKPDGKNADTQDVRDLLISNFGMTKRGAEDAIERARFEGAIERGDPQP